MTGFSRLNKRFRYATALSGSGNIISGPDMVCSCHKILNLFMIERQLYSNSIDLEDVSVYSEHMLI